MDMTCLYSEGRDKLTLLTRGATAADRVAAIQSFTQNGWQLQEDNDARESGDVLEFSRTPE